MLKSLLTSKLSIRSGAFSRFINSSWVMTRLQNIQVQFITNLLLLPHFILVTILLRLLRASLLRRVITLPTIVLQTVEVICLKLPLFQPLCRLAPPFSSQIGHRSVGPRLCNLGCSCTCNCHFIIRFQLNCSRHLFAFLGLTLRCSSHTWIWLKFRTSSESGISGPACSLLLWPGSIFKDNSLSPFWVRNGNSASVQVEGRHWRIFHRTECYLVDKLPCEPVLTFRPASSI